MKVKYSEGFKQDMKRLFSNNPFYSVPRMIRDARYAIKWGFQRMFRGYDDRACWGLYNYVTDIALPALIHMRAHRIGTPMVMYEYGEGDQSGIPTNTQEEAEAKWNGILDKMIKAFQMIHDDEKFFPPKEDQDIMNEGLELFGKYFQNLWD